MKSLAVLVSAEAPPRREYAKLGLCALLVALAARFAFPAYLSLASSVLISAIFAISLDIIMGYAGVVSLGHAVFFGVGAYAAGLIPATGWNEPISIVLASGACGAIAALMLGPFVLRQRGLALVMVTLAVNVLCLEAFNQAGGITGGDDGLYGLRFAPILGLFDWSIDSHVEYVYVLIWLVAIFLFAWRFVHSPFGVALRGLRTNRLRMELIGAPALPRLLAAYGASGFIAAMAGALQTEATRFVGLDTLSVEKSIDAVVMLVLGGVGTLFGPLIGAPLYIVIKDLSAQWNPHAWMIVIGALLIVVMLYSRGGVYGAVAAIARRGAGRRLFG